MAYINYTLSVLSDVSMAGLEVVFKEGNISARIFSYLGITKVNRKYLTAKNVPNLFLAFSCINSSLFIRDGDLFRLVMPLLKVTFRVRRARTCVVGVRILYG